VCANESGFKLRDTGGSLARLHDLTNVHRVLPLAQKRSELGALICRQYYCGVCTRTGTVLLLEVPSPSSPQPL
jgi:hypothetical protein